MHLLKLFSHLLCVPVTVKWTKKEIGLIGFNIQIIRNITVNDKSKWKYLYPQMWATFSFFPEEKRLFRNFQYFIFLSRNWLRVCVSCWKSKYRSINYDWNENFSEHNIWYRVHFVSRIWTRLYMHLELIWRTSTLRPIGPNRYSPGELRLKCFKHL